MSCSGYLERLRGEDTLREIQRKKHTLQRLIISFEVKGDFHKAMQVKAKLEKLEKITERMKQLLEA